MGLWLDWWEMVRELRPGFARERTFMWFVVCLAATSIRCDLLGVSSFVRTLGLLPFCYDRLLDMFHSRAILLDQLTRTWTTLVMRSLRAFLHRENGRIVLLADGIKAPKTGRKMPAVKKLHQESQNNTKPEYIFGHSCQAVALVLCAASTFFAMPLCCRIHEGLVFSNRDRRTLLDKLVLLIETLAIDVPFYLVADAYYASASIIGPLLKAGHHLVTAVRSNAVAYKPVEHPPRKGPGRKRVYGQKVHLKTLFQALDAFAQAPSPVYGETRTNILYHSMDLYWRPARQLVRFVWVIHPLRGQRIFMATDTTLSALQIIKLYGIRFKIEVAFKQAVHTLGTYTYHFWMATMTPRSHRSGNQYLHHKTESYREQVRRKMAAYHCHIQLGTIAQGMLQALAITRSAQVWKYFGSWLRTMYPQRPPSEFVVSIAMRHAFPLFLADSHQDHLLAKFIRDHIDLDRAEGLQMVA